VFTIDNASNKFDTFIPQLISLFPGVQPDSAVPNLPRHVVYVFISRGTIIPKPYNIRRVYQTRLGMFSICGIVLYNLFILINDKCEYLCKLEFVWHVQTINYLKLKIIHFQKGLVHAMRSNGPLHQVAYISNYVTKPGSKTYTIFDTIRSVFDKNSEMLGGTQKQKDKARSLITKIVNSLTAKLEIGGPMTSLYLLGNPDHYTDQNFVLFYWKSYVSEVLKGWKQDSDVQPDKVIIQKTEEGEYIGLSAVDDYKYRPYELNDKTLYEWIQISDRMKHTKVEQKQFRS